VDRRNHPRFKTQFDALCSTGEREGAGLLVDLSRSGARLEGVGDALPELGTKVRLYIFIQPVCPFELAGEVVRHEGSGFAISYHNLDPEIGRLVDDVAALVMGP
jgi:PilZ domain